MFVMTPSPKVSKAISELRDIKEDHHKDVLTPLEKYCADKMIEYIMKNPHVDFYLKSLMHNING